MQSPQSPERFSSALLIGTCGRLILQQRDDIPGILHPGMIGLFGGHREPGETPLDGIVRELEEEIGLRFPPERLAQFVSVQICPEATGRHAEIAIYLVRDVVIDGLVVTEGRLLAAEIAMLPGLYQRMTPTAAFTVRQYVVSHAGRDTTASAAVQAQQSQQ